jgi:hypothetical protein
MSRLRDVRPFIRCAVPTRCSQKIDIRRHQTAGTLWVNVQAFAAALKERCVDKGKLGTKTGQSFYT